MAQSDLNRKAPANHTLPEIPDKLYFRIGEVARLLDLEPYVLRFWESEFPQLKPNKGGTGQRLYRRRDLDMALRIRGLLYEEGYTIPGARQFLKSETKSKEPQLPFRGDARDDQTAALRSLRSSLREVARLLERPSPGARRTPNPDHRGLHVAPAVREPALQADRKADLDALLHAASAPAGKPDGAE